MANSDDNTARFWTYSNYLTALSQLIESEYLTQVDLINTIVCSPAFNKIMRGAAINYDIIAQGLRLSWYTELLLYKSIAHADILPYATPWSMVQTYYAVYPTIRAYFLATGRDIGKSHEATLTTIGSDLTSCKNRFPKPWCCVYDGDPGNSANYLVNVSVPISFTLSNALQSPIHGDPWQHFGLFLKTTRERKLLQRIEKWKKDNNKKKIPKINRCQLLQQMRPTNIFDAFYRVRTRSNYHDIDSFAFTSIRPFNYRMLQIAMCQIVDSTLAVFETMIAKAIGKKNFGKMVQEFSVTPLGNDTKETYQKRWNIIEHLL